MINNLTYKGFLIRGGVTRGPVYTNILNNIIFGPGLITAYELESKIAKEPRVILDSKIIKICKKYTTGYNERALEDILGDVVNLDDDGLYYIDYFKPFGLLNKYYVEQILVLRKVIVEGLKEKDKSIINKYIWMKRKFNSFLNDRQLKYKNSKFTSKDSKDVLKIRPI
jgi:hypothetical protein